MGIFSSFKDNLSSYSGEQFVKKALERYGEVMDFKINSSSKTIFLKVKLKGETEPVNVNVNRYELVEEKGKLYIKIHDIQTSKEWLNTLAEDYLIRQRFEIPGNYSSLVKKFI